MAKKIYRAVRTSSFMPVDQGNKWVVIAPNGDIIHDWARKDQGLRQNDAIRIAKGLNDGSLKFEEFRNTFS